jgi:NADH dehydrogenase (ubiquinone) 1 alpha/beta subcomplex 1
MFASVARRTVARLAQPRALRSLPAAMQTRLFATEADEHMSHYLPVDEVKGRVLEVLKGFDKVDSDKVSETSNFADDLGLDSLDTVEVVMQFEDEFNIEISDENAEKILTAKDAIDYVAKHPFAN